MNPQLRIPTLLLLALATFNLQPSILAQGTAFTYQGRLNAGANPAGGIYDLRFAIYDASASGTLIAGPLTNAATGVTNGLFTVTLDFGSVFNGNARWLDIAVRTNGPGAFAILAPRQALTATPYASYAASAAAAGSVASGAVATAGLQDGAVTASKIGVGNVVKALNLLKDDVTLVAGDNVSLTPFGQTLTFATPTDWHIGGNAGTTPGFSYLGTTDNQPLELRVNNTTALKLQPSAWGASVAAGGGATASGATAVAMGYLTTASGAGAVAFGDRTSASGWESAAWGEVTTASGDYATAMGNYTKATNSCATALGTNTLAGGVGSTAMGRNTKALGSSSVSMGLWSIASGANSLAGGYSCSALGSSSVALGYYAYADHGYSFVWNDGSSGSSGDIHTTAQNQFVIGASGGVGIGAAPGDAMLDIQGNVRLNKNDLFFREGTDRNHGLGWYGAGKLFGTTSPDGPVVYGYSGGGLGSTSGGAQLALQWFSSGNVTVRGTLSQGSDRNAKTDFASVNPREVLDRVAALPIQTWRYKAESDGTHHLGPVSQDFHAAFGLGEDDRHITTVDEGGVALAAIQGLNQKLEEKETRIRELEARLEKLERLINADK